MLERDTQILRHIGLHRVSTRPVLQRLFFGAAHAGNVIQRLRDEKLIVARRKGLPGNRAYYQLTPGSASALGFPASRAEPFGARALATHLAILSFCCLDDTQRVRVDPPDLAAVLDGAIPGGDHCIERRGGSVRIFQLYAPGAFTTREHVLRRIRGAVATAERDERLSQWIQARLYGFAVLVDNRHQSAALNEALRGERLDGRPLRQRCEVAARVIPAWPTPEETSG